MPPCLFRSGGCSFRSCATSWQLSFPIGTVEERSALLTPRRKIFLTHNWISPQRRVEGSLNWETGWFEKLRRTGQEDEKKSTKLRTGKEEGEHDDERYGKEEEKMWGREWESCNFMDLRVHGTAIWGGFSPEPGKSPARYLVRSLPPFAELASTPSPPEPCSSLSPSEVQPENLRRVDPNTASRHSEDFGGGRWKRMDGGFQC